MTKIVHCSSHVEEVQNAVKCGLNNVWSIEVENKIYHWNLSDHLMNIERFGPFSLRFQPQHSVQYSSRMFLLWSLFFECRQWMNVRDGHDSQSVTFIMYLLCCMICLCCGLWINVVIKKRLFFSCEILIQCYNHYYFYKRVLTSPTKHFRCSAIVERLILIM